MKKAGKHLSWKKQKAHVNWAPTVCQALCLSFNPCNDIVIQGLQTRKRRPRDVNSFAQVIQWIGGRAVPKIWALDTDPGQMSAGRQGSCWSQSSWSSYFVEQSTFPPNSGLSMSQWGGRLVLTLEESQFRVEATMCPSILGPPCIVMPRN